MTVAALPRRAPAGRRVLLPPEPLVEAVKAAAAARQTTPGVLLGAGSAELRAYYRACQGRKAALTTVDTICGRLGRHVSEVYGQGWEPPPATTAPRRPARGAARIRLTIMQTVYDRMAAAAVDGCWTGHLLTLIGTVDADVAADQVRGAMVAHGWIACARRGGGRRRADGTSAPSTWRLVARPESPAVPCGWCATPLPALTVDGALASRPPGYCTPACRASAAKAAYARKLDRLRAAAGLRPTGAQHLSNHELDQLLARLRALLRPAA